MRTEVQIIFDGDDYPGGAKAVLSAARCGSDVATVTDIVVFGTLLSRSVVVTLEASDKRLRVLVDLLAKHEIRWTEHRTDRYTVEELDQAPLILMRPEDEIRGGPAEGTRYDVENACQACGAEARQTSPLIINGDYRDRLEGQRAVSTFQNDILVDQKMAEKLEVVGTTGLSFRAVFASRDDKRQIKLPWRQMCAARSLPPMSLQSTGVDRESTCYLCERGSFLYKPGEQLGLVYRAKDLADIDDVNTTWEWFEEFEFDSDMNLERVPYPLFLVTPKVMRTVQAAGLNRIHWLPVRVES